MSTNTIARLKVVLTLFVVSLTIFFTLGNVLGIFVLLFDLSPLVNQKQIVFVSGISGIIAGVLYFTLTELLPDGYGYTDKVFRKLGLVFALIGIGLIIVSHS